ncbi:hypothetical protein SAMN05444158_5701 [Bradyrhizobium canariense]|uniref:Uncharacterized protein n=2 Tax=Bradyrhizobium canariense TaxID=255045 RepID=A0A1H1ZVW2_9BRAD|nr:hypothetical protein SAMN05444158_5701 [Bradyrhizobium canariense]
MHNEIKLQNSTRASIRKTMRGAMERLLMFLWSGSPTQYWPAAHYMRGRGPKWREKHGGLQEDSNLVKILNSTSEKWNV